ncbi:MAG: hypothetical protein PUD65_11130 [Spirochaetales bacterium]|nr:hypothetical protein [Spirochaetales bacterium]
MKRLIAVLLVMGVIMTAFAETAVVPDGTGVIAAQTNVVLEMNQNIAVVWFTKGEENTTWYNLTLPQNLEQNTSSWVAEGNDLYLNWNIVSKDKVQIDLSISAPMKSGSNAIGWNVAFTKLSTNGLDNGTSATILTKESSDSTSTVKVGTAYLKNGTVYGNKGSLPISITTENIYGKNIGTYTAVITATVKTYN